MSELDKAVQNLRADMDGPSRTLALALEGKAVVDRAELTAVLDRLAELEAKAEKKPELDRLCDLKVGDEVEVVRNIGDSVFVGTRGVVEKLVAEEFPIRVRIPGRTLVGFARNELGKVVG